MNLVRSSRVDTFTLVSLGRLTLLSPRGDESESLAKRRLKLALLAVLATAKRPVSRATLAEMFWGEQEECRARHSLSDALSHLRRELGRLAIASQGSEVWLNPDAPLALDVATFEDAVAARDLSRAASLYTGPFLDGVEIEAGPSFEQWASRERRRLETVFLQVCAQQCLAYARAREWEECGSLAARWLETAPLSVDAALYRLNAVKSPGTREAAQRALDEFEQLSGRLAREFDLAPEKPVLELAQNLRDGLDTLPAAPITVAAPSIPAPAAPVVAPNEAPAPTRLRAPLASPTKAGSPFGRRLTRATTAGIGLVALVAALAARSRTGNVNASTRPRVAIAVDVKDADSTTAWLADGLPQMMMSELSRSPEVEVVPPAQVRALLRRRSGTRVSRPAAGEDLRDLAHRLGATIVVAGTVGRDDRSIVLDLAVRDVATGRLLRNDALSRRDVPALADEAAARVLATVNAQRPGFRFTDLETSSVEAFQHFVRAMQAAQEGRTHEAYREMDAAIALDSGFVTAVHARMDWALATGESDVADRLRGVLATHGDGSSEFDQLQTQALDALYRGETERSEAMARQLVRRFPRDPRAYGVLNGVLSNTGQFEAAESMWQAALSLDSLAMEAGSGPCGPCVGYGNLARIQAQEGKWEAAEHSARRWVELQPDAPASWEMLAGVLSYRQRHREAIDAVQRAVTLSGRDPSTLDMWARLLIAARQYDTADSLVRSWLTSESPQLRASAYDLRVLLLRERGELRASNVALDRSEAALPNAGVQTVLVRGNNLGRLGDYAGAELLYERSAHGPRLETRFPPVGTASRGFCWHHALLADAVAPSGDTARLRGLADTLAVGCARSFFGRDRRLHHHVRGLLAMMEGRWFDAEAELQQARWGVAESWTRSNVALAKTEMALNQPRAALAALRDAYASPLDGMGRYQPRSELDLLMAQAFSKAGDADSARVYEAYVHRAWRNADPELKRLLGQLPDAN